MQSVKRTRSSQNWLREHESDVYVRRARESGYRSRAVYKLEQIDGTDRLVQPGMVVVDLGAAPGGWSQYAARRVGDSGRVIALDLLPMDAIPGVEFIQGDFADEATVSALLHSLDAARVQLVMSDMAPNMSGIADVDHLRSMHLVELALDFAERVLLPGGDFLVKVFQGRDFQSFVARLRRKFGTVKSRKPKASRARSSELYLLARNYRM